MPQIALAAYAIYQGVQAGQQAKAAGNAAAAARAQQQAIGSEDQAYWRDTYGPVNQMLIDYAMGNKPSPYLAAAKGKVEQGYQQGVTQLNELQGRAGLTQSGIGVGQKIGLNMERAKAEAGLNLQDQAQRYGIAQGLAPMIQNEQKSAGMAAGAVGDAANDASRNAASASAAAGGAFKSASGALGSALGSDAEQYGMGDWFNSGGKSPDQLAGPGPTTTLSTTGQNMGSTLSGDYGYNQAITPSNQQIYGPGTVTPWAPPSGGTNPYLVKAGKAGG